MNTKHWALCASLALIGLGALPRMTTAGTAVETAAGVFVEGRPAPKLELPRIDHQGSIDLGDAVAFAGRKVILLQFASW